MTEKKKANYLDMGSAERQSYFRARLRDRSPEGLNEPEYVSSLCCYLAGGEKSGNISAVLIVRADGKCYLLDDDMNILTPGYMEITPFAKAGCNSLCFKVFDGAALGIIDYSGKPLSDIKYQSIRALSLTRERDGGFDFMHTDLFSCAVTDKSGERLDVLDAYGTLIFSGLCGIDECEVTRRYSHYNSSHEVGGEYYSEKVESLYIYREYDLSDENCPDYFPEYAFRVSVFDMLLGYAVGEPDEQVALRYADYPRQLGKLNLRRDFVVPSRQFEDWEEQYEADYR